jgi:hypothetical protein
MTTCMTNFNSTQVLEKIFDIWAYQNTYIYVTDHSGHFFLIGPASNNTLLAPYTDN